MSRRKNQNLPPKPQPPLQHSKSTWDIATKISAATLIATLVNIGVTSVLTWYSKQQDITLKQQESRLKEMEIAMPLLRKDAAENYPQDVIAGALVKVRDYFSVDYRPITGVTLPPKVEGKPSTTGATKLDEPTYIKTIKLKPCDDDPDKVCPRS